MANSALHRYIEEQLPNVNCYTTRENIIMLSTYPDKDMGIFVLDYR